MTTEEKISIREHAQSLLRTLNRLHKGTYATEQFKEDAIFYAMKMIYEKGREKGREEGPDASNDKGSTRKEDLAATTKFSEDDEDMLSILERFGPFARAGLDLGILVERKQMAYGNSVGRTGAILRVLYPNGVPLAAYDDMMLIVRVLDKFNRMASNPEGDLMDESPWRDVAGYGLLGQAQHDKKNKP